jgi:uncharacterized protein YndB with AHSA1/START domain
MSDMAEAELARFIDRYTAEYVRTYTHPIDCVWRAITDPRKFDDWFIPGDIDLQVGGKFRFAAGQWTGVVLAIDPPRLIRLRSAHDENGYFQYELTEVKDGTRMRFVQAFSPGVEYPGFDPEMPGSGTPWPGAISGWHEFWDALGDYLDGLPVGSSLPPSRFGAIAASWAEKAHEFNYVLTPDQLDRILRGLRRKERWHELNGIYADHMRATLQPPAAIATGIQTATPPQD